MAKDSNSKSTPTRKGLSASKRKPRPVGRQHATTGNGRGLKTAARTSRVGPRVRPHAVETGANFTFYVNPSLALVCIPPDDPAVFSLEVAARITGVHPEMLRYYSQSGLIEILQGETGTDLFVEGSVLDEIRRIEYYRRHLGVGRRALPLICELQREAERQDIELSFLRPSPA